MKFRLVLLPFLLCLLMALPPAMAEQRAREPRSTDKPPLVFEDVVDFELYELLKKGINTHVVWSGNARHPSIALTFDDGPNARITPEVLRILEQYKVPATFFLIGQHAQQYPELVKQIVGAGHDLGNHTYSHVELPSVSSADITVEVEKTREIVQQIIGQTTVLFRPPWGLFDGRSLAALAMRKFDAVLWSVDSRDWSHPGVDVIKNNIVSKVRNGSIILCHDDNEQIVQALPDIITSLQEQGYRFVTVGELLAGSLLESKRSAPRQTDRDS